jgi:hypothetical protein
MPSWSAEWLPEDHLAWFVLAAVDEMELAAFYAADRRDGHGRAAQCAVDDGLSWCSMGAPASLGWRLSRSEGQSLRPSRVTG